MTTTGTRPAETIRTPDQRIRVFVSSTLGELAEERRAPLAARQQRWETAARAAAADALRERVGLPARPVTRDLHDAAVHATSQRLGDKEVALRAEAMAADPWVLIDDALNQFAIGSDAHRNG